MDPTRPASRPVVLTTFRPTADFARRIAGDLVDVRCPVPEDEDPIFWQPSRDVLEQYRAADLVIVNGAEYEKWVATASLPASRVVDTAAGFRDAWLVHAGSVTHSHGGAGAHTHEGIDGHTWLDPLLARRQAEAIASAFTRTRPEHAAAFTAGMRTLAAQLDALDARWTSLAARLRGCRVLASHPAYDYVARRYEVTIVNVLLDPDAAWDEQTAALVAEALGRADAAADSERPVDGSADPSAPAPHTAPALLLWESPPNAYDVAIVRISGGPCNACEPLEIADMNLPLRAAVSPDGSDGSPVRVMRKGRSSPCLLRRRTS